MTHFRYAIAGGGLVAGYAAQTFAEAGIKPGELGIISAEAKLPYERPPLSKDFLAGDESEADILINEPAFYGEHGIQVMLNTRVTGARLTENVLETEAGPMTFEKLLIATGAQVRRLALPGDDLSGVFYLRRMADARAIHEAARRADRAVIIGGSFIAMEVTAVLTELGLETAMIFPEKRVWQQFFAPEMSRFFESYYREKGVNIRPGSEVKQFRGRDGYVSSVELQSGEVVPADMVVLGVGVLPNGAVFGGEHGVQLSEEGAVVVNRFLETSCPDVYAAGDVARYRDIVYDRPQRIEHWDNAVVQGQHAARGMLGKREAFVHVPYFFSDEFDLSYEFWGDIEGANRLVYRGDVGSGSFSAWWLQDDRLLAAFVMDRPDEEREQASRWIREGAHLLPERLGDVSQALASARLEA